MIAAQRPVLCLLAFTTLVASIGCAETEETADIGVTRQAFSNQYNDNIFQGYRDPVHEMITDEGLWFLRREVRNYIASENALYDLRHLSLSGEAHFDGCAFKESSKEIQRNYASAVKNALDFPSSFDDCDSYLGFCGADSATSLKSFAAVLHTVQDFYSHTNWVESGGSTLFDDSLGKFPMMRPYKELKGMIIVEGSHPAWDVLMSVPLAGYPENMIAWASHSNGNGSGLRSGRGLVSGDTDGLSGDFQRCPSSIEVSHGDLNKDYRRSGRVPQYEQAVTLATKQTTHEWCRFMNLVSRSDYGSVALDQLCENWIEDHQDAAHACRELPASARCCPAGSRRGGDAITCFCEDGITPAVDVDGDSTADNCEAPPQECPENSEYDPDEGVCFCDDGITLAVDVDGDGTADSCMAPQGCPENSEYDPDKGLCICDGGMPAIDIDGDGTQDYCPTEPQCPTGSAHDPEEGTCVCDDGTPAVDTDADGTQDYCPPPDCPTGSLYDPDEGLCLCPDGVTVAEDIDQDGVADNCTPPQTCLYDRRVCVGDAVHSQDMCGGLQLIEVCREGYNCLLGFCLFYPTLPEPPDGAPEEALYTGTLIDSITGDPVTNATITFDDGTVVQTSETGWFGAVLPTGQRTATVERTSTGERDGYAPSEFSFSHSAGSAAAVTVPVECSEPTGCSTWAPGHPECTGDACAVGSMGHFSVLTGDPHIRTFDGLYYDMQAVGEFVLTRSLDDDLEVQARTTAWDGRTDVSANSAIAAMAHGDRVALYNDGPDQWSLLLNGLPLEIADGSATLAGGATLAIQGDRIVLTWLDGSQLYLWTHEVHVDINTVLPSARGGRVQGLHGNSNGTPSDDLVTSEGLPVQTAGPFRAFYDGFVESWRVTNPTSLFDYASGEDTETYTDRTIPTFPTAVEDLDDALRAAALQTCEQHGVTSNTWLEACILDVALTGDDTFAITSAAAVEVLDQMVLARPPKVTIDFPANGDVVQGAPTLSGFVESTAPLVHLVATVNGVTAVDIEVPPGPFDIAVPVFALEDGVEATAVLNADALDGNTGRALVTWTSENLPCCFADNCPAEPHPDIDGDGILDACDDDDDGDGVANAVDNCPEVADPDQTDTDADGAGNPCDEDLDGDAAANEADNCPFNFNPSQADMDGDGVGNSCDADADADGVEEPDDNCPLVSNPTQSDSDGDGIGDACDGLEQRFLQTLPGGGIAAAGVGFAGRDGSPMQQATITLQSLPDGAEIVDAQLYWGTIGGQQSTITLGGTPLVGELIGLAGDTCWSRPQGNAAFRADVNALVTGNGEYELSDFPSQSSGLDGQGATLLVIYEMPGSTQYNTVVLAENIETGAGGSINSSLRGFVIPNTIGSVTALNVVGDGQSSGDQLSFNGIYIDTTNAFPGADGNYWDTRFDDITDYVGGGDDSILVTVHATGDCLVWIVAGAVIEPLP